MTRKFFGTDGIRGLANKVITPDLAMKVGQAAGLVFQNGDYRHRVVIGKDTRLSGYMIENALVAGFTSVGMDVLLLGPMPTPAVAMLTRSHARRSRRDDLRLAQSLFEDNGIKLFGPDGYKLSDEVERQIEMPDGVRPAAQTGQIRGISAAPSASTTCAPAISNSPSAPCRATCRFEGMRVVIDCANGAAYKVAPEVLWELGAEVFSIGVAPDGININQDCGSTAPAGAARQGARAARRFRHRARRRRRPGGDGRRAWPICRRRPDSSP